MKNSIILIALGFLSAAVTANPLPAQASSATASSASSEPTFGIAKRRRVHQCDAPWMKKIEAQAWADAGFIAEQAVTWDNKQGNALQGLMDYWMGTDSVKDDNAKVIKNILSNENKIHNPNWIFPEAVVDVYCGEHPIYNTQCRLQTNPRDPNGPKVTAYATARVGRGFFWNSYSITLCPRFFNEKYALEEILKNMTDGTLDRYDAENYKKAWGFTYYHELTHLDPIISATQAGDVVYGACGTRKLALQNNCNGPVKWKPKGGNYAPGQAVSTNNADSFAFFGAASLFKYRFGIGDDAKAPDTCGINNPNTLANETYTDWDDNNGADSVIVEGLLLNTTDITDGTFNYTTPPDPSAENTPADDEVVPLQSPYTSRPLPTNLARPYADAVAYFSTRTTTSDPTYPPTTVPASLSSLGQAQRTSSSSSPISSPQSSSAAPTASACQGNQIEGSCTQASLPSQSPDSGPDGMVCNKVDSNDDWLMFNDDKASQAASTYCQNLIDGKVVLNAQSSSPKPGYVANAAENGGYVAFAVLFDVDSCDPGTSSANQKVDFGAMTADQCYQLLYTPIQMGCAKDSTWGDYNPNYSIEGGSWAGQCALWSVSGLPGSPP